MVCSRTLSDSVERSSGRIGRVQGINVDYAGRVEYGDQRR
jgi:hypothetical protein